MSLEFNLGFVQQKKANDIVKIFTFSLSILNKINAIF